MADKEGPNKSSPDDGELTPERTFDEARKVHKAGDTARASALYQDVIRELEEVPDQDPTLLAQATAFRALAERERVHQESTPLSTFFALLLGLGVWALAISGVVAIFSESVRAWWGHYWLYAVAGALGLGALMLFGQWVDSKLAHQPPARRRFAVAFVVIPLIALAMMGVVGLKPPISTLVVELILVLVAALFPAAAFYLFLATRRASILNEFLANLSRLGLLSPRMTYRSLYDDQGEVVNVPYYESPEESRARIEGYFQRFEGLYGKLRFGQSLTTRAEFVRNLIDAIGGRERLRYLPQSELSLADIFRPDVILPIGLVTVLTTLGWLLTLQPELFPVVAAGQGGSSLAITPVWAPLPFAFLGAYFFGIQMLFRRFVRRDLGPNAYLAFANRILLSVVAVWVALAAYQALAPGKLPDLTKAATQTGQWPATALVLAFAVGVFPRIVWQFVAAVFSKILKLKRALPTLEAKQPLHRLDGLTVWHETRLEEEDVENVPNMATVDVVDIMLHTQIPAERLVNWIDQAILLATLGPSSDCAASVRPLGLNTASQVVAAFNGSQEERAALENVLGTDVMNSLANALTRQPNFEAVRAWRRV